MICCYCDSNSSFYCICKLLLVFFVSANWFRFSRKNRILKAINRQKLHLLEFYAKPYWNNLKIWRLWRDEEDLKQFEELQLNLDMLAFRHISVISLMHIYFISLVNSFSLVSLAIWTQTNTKDQHPRGQYYLPTLLPSKIY